MRKAFKQPGLGVHPPADVQQQVWQGMQLEKWLLSDCEQQSADEHQYCFRAFDAFGGLEMPLRGTCM